MSKRSSRREFLRETAAGTIAASIGTSLLVKSAQAEELLSGAPAVSTSTRRVLGANDRVNFGFIGMGDRMGAHTGYLSRRQKDKADVQAVAIAEIYEKRKKRGQQQTGVDDKSIYHDYRELCARKDIDAVVIATPDHWHARHALEALNQGKHVYLEKPMTYTIGEARDLALKVKEKKLVLQVGSQHLSDFQFWKAREVISQGAIGKVLWATTSYSRNTPTGEWNWPIDPDEEANERTIDWKAFLGSAPKRPFDKDRYFRWRKYWDYSGGMATDLFYHRLSPIMVAVGNPEFPTRVTAGGGIYSPVDGDIRDVPDTYFTSIEFPGKYAVLIGSSMLNSTGFTGSPAADGRPAGLQPQLIRGTQATMYLEGKQLRIVAERPYAKEFAAKHGANEWVIDVEAAAKSGGEAPGWTSDHMGNFINAARGKEAVHFDAELGWKAMVAIRLGIDAYRSGQTMYYDAAKAKATTKPTFRA
ncbi:MAG TPA: Gfo/Idh/MocA family oxidoreductase [Blastocatellia bacterium]|nr:Gfo/Idh/MocA family oxidoreductase [Blastocatellia bacterium]